MYKKDEHYTKTLSKSELEGIISKKYNGEDGLVIQLMSNFVQDDMIHTGHELSVANENLWGLNDWPKGEGFGTSDFFHYNKMIDEAIAHERAYHKAEQELATINKLEKAPKYESVRTFMKMNEKLAEGMVA